MVRKFYVYFQLFIPPFVSEIRHNICREVGAGELLEGLPGGREMRKTK